MTPESIRPLFNDAAQQGFSPSQDGHLTFLIRTDAAYATGSVKKSLLAYMQASGNPQPESYITRTVHDAYETWGDAVLKALATCLDANKYGISTLSNGDVHLFNTQALTDATKQKARELATAYAGKQSPFIMVSLDELIHDETGSDEWADVGFSRLFSTSGDQHFGYVARPGKQSLDAQIDALAAKVGRLAAAHGGPVPVVLLEDNVRQAKMVNWIIGEMDKRGVFTDGHLAGIATCFCCADEQEQEKIQFKGKTVPLAIVADYSGIKANVFTPRDLLFDGFVVQGGDQGQRLQGLFMDLEQMFSLRPGTTDTFRRQVLDASLAFCDRLKAAFGTPPPLSWFANANMISDITGLDLETPMTDVLQSLAQGNTALAQDKKDPRQCRPSDP